MITSVAAGSTAIVVSLPTWGFAQLDTNGFVPPTQLPITKEQGMRALRLNLNGAITWLSYCEDALALSHGDTTDLTNIAYNGALWPIGGIVWTFIQNTLATALGAFTPTQLAALQTQAATNR